MVDVAEDIDGLEDDALDTPSKSKLPLLMVVLGVGALAAGGYLAYQSKQPKADKEQVQDESTTGSGPIEDLDTFLVNLRSEEEVHYLKCSVSVELKGQSWVEPLHQHLVPIRSAIILYLSSLSLVDTQGTANKEKILAAVKKRAAQVLGDGAITQIYLREFVIQ